MRLCFNVLFGSSLNMYVLELTHTQTQRDNFTYVQLLIHTNKQHKTGMKKELLISIDLKEHCLIPIPPHQSTVTEDIGKSLYKS